MISKYFTWKEALYLPQYDREANEKDGLNQEIKDNLVKVFGKLDIIRDFFKSPIIVHVAYRSVEYNKLVKGAKNSSHLYGMAVDFHIKGVVCDDVRKKIVEKGFLDSLDMRMEDLPGSSWVHLDIRPVVKTRFFKP